jgi:predicted transcriptional regulator
MAVKPEYRERDEVEVAILGALSARADDGMTVFEVRAAVDADIDRLEVALSDLKAEDLITTEQRTDRLVIFPADHVVADPSETEDDETSIVDAIRDRIGL